EGVAQVLPDLDGARVERHGGDEGDDDAVHLRALDAVGVGAAEDGPVGPVDDHALDAGGGDDVDRRGPGDGGGGDVGGGQGLQTRGEQGHAVGEGVHPGVARREVVIGRQGGRPGAGGELDGAGVAVSDVVERVQGGNGDREGLAGRHRAGGADAEVVG